MVAVMSRPSTFTRDSIAKGQAKFVSLFLREADQGRAIMVRRPPFARSQRGAFGQFGGI